MRLGEGPLGVIGEDAGVGEGQSLFDQAEEFLGTLGGEWIGVFEVDADHMLTLGNNTGLARRDALGIDE